MIKFIKIEAALVDNRGNKVIDEYIINLDFVSSIDTKQRTIYVQKGNMQDTYELSKRELDKILKRTGVMY